MNWVLLGAAALSMGFLVFTLVLLAVDADLPLTSFDILFPILLEVVVFAGLGGTLMLSVLQVDIDPHGVRVRFAPFHRTPRTFAWTDVERIIIRKVSPFGEFGGWGIRWNFSKTTGYVWRGTHGLDLRMRDGRRVVITIVDIASAMRAVEASIPAGVEYENRLLSARR